MLATFGKSRQGMSMSEILDKMRYAAIITEGYKGMIKIETFKSVPIKHINEIQLKDIRTKEDIQQWLKEQKEREFDILTKGFFIIDEVTTWKPWYMRKQ